MSKAPVGALVSIYYDSPRPVEPGDALQTPSGRVYVIAEIRVQARGKHKGRKHMKCVVADTTEGISGQVHPIYWYPRGRRK
jgi:hypothetical protein